ncbi:MAG: ABC transporter permease [Gemmatimonadaceae bacterium]
MAVSRTIRFGVRQLVRTPGFTVAAVLTLALGIGLATAVFTVADALILRPLPVADQSRLITLSGALADGSRNDWPLTLPQTREFSRQTRALRNTGYYAYEGAWPVAVRSGDQLSALRRALVSGNFFDVLGARAMLGRGLEPSDDVIGAAPVVVLSHRAWRAAFGGDPNLVGRSLSLTEFGITAKIVGVMPPGLEYPEGADFWAPFVPSRLSAENDTTAYTALYLLGRLAPGATGASAARELGAYLEREVTSRKLRAVSHPFAEVVLGDTRTAVLIFAAAAVLLLLITCLDVANLLVVRGLSRVREIAVRNALGGSRAQIVTQLMVENATLALVGGALGVVVATVCLGVFRAFAPSTVPLLEVIHLDVTALGGALGITTLATLLFGLAPALVTSRAEVQEVLRSGTRQSGSRRSRLAREALVAGQVAVATLLLSAAALVGRSFLSLRGVDLRFDASKVVVAELAIRYDQYGDIDKQTQLVRALIQALRSEPGVDGVSPVVAMPFSGNGGWTGSARRSGQSPAEAKTNPVFNMDVVTPDYFPTMGLRVLRGRALSNDDQRGAERVIVVSQTMAHTYWPNEDAIGQRLFMTAMGDPFTVVGVVDDIHYRDLRQASPSVYYALAQSDFPFAPTTFVVRTSAPESVIVPTLRRVIANTAPGVELTSAAPFERYMEAPLAQPRLNAILLAVFAGSATLLAAIGLGGVVATTVRQRRQELGIRMALGATRGSIQRMILKQSLMVAIAGVAIGVGAALVTNRALEALLYGVSPTDPRVLLTVVALLTLIAVVAALLPTWRAGHIEPSVALRTEG